MEFKDYYATLGVAKTATEKEIKQAYRKLARKLHPDVNPGDKAKEARFKEINEAYEVLGDPGRRRKYDELGANWRLYEQGGGAPPGPGGGGGWRVDFGGPGGFRTVTDEELGDILGGDPFSDFFKTFFAGGEGQARPRPAARGARRRAPGQDVEQALELTLEEAHRGVTTRVSIKRDGHARTVDVRIPAGIKDGSRVRVPGEGGPGAAGGASGDLYLRIHVLPHADFERRGHDLHVRLPVPVATAALGGSAEVPTLDGKALRLRVPEATQNGQVFRLRGHGMPVVGRAGEHGDLYAVVDIRMPRTLTPEERRHYEALAAIDAGRQP